MPFLAQKNQPTNAIFELEIGGLTKIFDYGSGEATIPMSFNLKETNMMGMGTLTFVTFDDTGFDVEPHFWLAKDENKGGVPIGRVRWGYTAQNGENLSDWRTFQLSNYNVSILDNFFTLTASGNLTAATPVMGCNQYTGTLNEVLKKFAEVHQYALEINPSIDDSKTKSPDQAGGTTEYKTAKFIKTNEETDLFFVQRLIPYAMSADGKTGYVLSFVTEDDTEKMKVMLPENASSGNTYTVQDKDSVVIEWNPNISFTPTMVLGADQIIINSTNPVTGEEQKFVHDIRLTRTKGSELGAPDIMPDSKAYPKKADPTQVKQYCSENMEEAVKSRGLRVQKGPSFDPVTGYNKTLSDHLAQALMNNTATLKILGDPFFVPNTKIEVIFYYPHSFRFPEAAGTRKHYTSGTYFCREVEHEIVNGLYTTILTLSRFGVETQPT